MTLSQLEYCITLQQSGSFKKAAEKLSISQPGLSLQVQKLEDEIGLKLFNRSRSPIEPTPDGKPFLVRAEEVVINARKLSEFASDLKDNFSGLMNVGIIPTLAPFLVPLFSESLQQDYPEFRLDIYEQTTEKVIQGVRNGSLDAGIISTPIDIYGVTNQPLFYEKFYWYSSEETAPSHLSPEEINYSKLWILEEGNCFRDQINNFCDLNRIRKNKQFIYRSNSIDALIRVVDTRGGITILPELTTLSLSADQESYIHEFSGTPKAREIGLITRSGFDKGRYLEKLVSYIQSNIPKHMLSDEGLEVVDPAIEVD